MPRSCSEQIVRWSSCLLLVFLHVVTGQATRPVEGSVRVMGGPGNSSGLVQVYHQRKWGLVCDNQWHQDAARLVCRQLGYEGGRPEPGMVFQLTDPESVLGVIQYLPLHMSEVHCVGSERRLTDCRYVDATDCEHDDAAGVTCTGDWRDPAVYFPSDSAPTSSAISRDNNPATGVSQASSSTIQVITMFLGVLLSLMCSYHLLQFG